MKITGDEDFDEMIERCAKVLNSKGIDYGSKEDRLEEFRETSKEMDITMKQVLGSYTSKHYRSIKKHLRGENLLGEGIDEKILDVINYMLLLYKMEKEKRREEDSSFTTVSLPYTTKYGRNKVFK